jgi:hypothetical protein
MRTQVGAKAAAARHDWGNVCEAIILNFSRGCLLAVSRACSQREFTPQLH